MPPHFKPNEFIILSCAALGLSAYLLYLGIHDAYPPFIPPVPPPVPPTRLELIDWGAVRILYEQGAPLPDNIMQIAQRQGWIRGILRETDLLPQVGDEPLTRNSPRLAAGPSGTEPAAPSASDPAAPAAGLWGGGGGGGGGGGIDKGGLR